MLTYKQAQELIIKQAHSFGDEKVPLEQSFGRVLAENIRSDRDYPPFNRAAMDGYAFRLNDFEKGSRQFEIVDTIFAGQVTSKNISASQCYKIMTGASVPADADVIVRREDTVESADTVKIVLDEFHPFQNIARRGEDFKQDDTIIDKPVICNAAVISLLAAIGKQSVTARKKPAVAIITTGHEVVSINSPVSPVQIRNSNAWLLKALLAKQSISPVSAEHVVDDKLLLRQAFEKVLNADIIISCGGVSAGDADYIPAVAEELGIKKLFHKVAIKPGKPVWCGSMPGGGMLFALPGNPFSCLVTFTLFIQQYLYACYGITGNQPMQLLLSGERNKKSNLDEIFPVQLIKESAMVAPQSFNGSGDIQAALQADGIAIHPSAIQRLENGARVLYLPL